MASNPLYLSGPEFLKLYVLLLAVSAGIAFLLRWLMRQPGGEAEHGGVNLEAYETAYLAGGPRQAAGAALAGLVQGNVLRLNHDGRVSTLGQLPMSASSLDKAVVRAAEGGTTVGQVLRSASATAEALRPRLEEHGLLLSPMQELTSRWLPLMVVAPVVCLGVAKAVRGWSAGKPVGFLLVLLAVSAGILFVLPRNTRRSRRGDRALKKLQGKHSALKQTSERNASSLAPQDVAMAVGLFGAAAVMTAGLAPLQAAMHPPSWLGVGDGTSSGSSCSSSSCGSSCGGGGCGGCS